MFGVNSWNGTSAVVVVALCAGAGTGAVVDLARRRIPNTVSVATAAAGVVLAAVGASDVTLPSSLLGFAVGLLLMLPGHVLGATGAGDVKLFAAAGAVLGAARVLQAFVLVAVAGGVLALGVAWWRGRLGRTMAHTVRLCGRPLVTRPLIEAPTEQNRFPYGPAIAVGSVLAALL